MNYLEKLNQAWQDHLVPKSKDAPTVISTFAGCGGSSLGYSSAGYRELLAVEWDKHAVETFRRNFPKVPVYHGDIGKLTVEQCLEMARIRSGELDVFDGSPPCQGFSTSGKRAFTDNRNQLFKEYVRLLRGLKPKVFVMENVSGMVKGKMKLIFAEIMKELKASGYQVSARLLNASHYGVPQARERVIFIGVRNDLGILPSHPLGSNNVITAKEALRDCTPSEIMPLVGKNLTKMQLIRPGAPYKEKKRASLAVFGKVSGFTLIRFKWNAPAPTILKTVCVSPTFGAGLIMPDEDRYLSISELKRLGSFPDQFEITGKFEERWARIGNSVPPLLMRSIALHIKNAILAQVKTAASPQPGAAV